jgi:hypothetical protein
MRDWLLAHYDFLKDFSGPVVSLVGILAATTLAICGLKTFGTWKRERLEERRIEVALEGLSIARESKYVFGRIRNPAGFEGEWHSMPVREGESDGDRDMRGPSYATLVRLDTDHDFFERVSQFLPKAVALFDDQVEAIFEKLESAHNRVRDAAVQLTWQLPVRPEMPSEEDFAHRMQLRADLWAGFGTDDKVEEDLVAFRSETEALLRKVISRKSW